MNPTSFGSGFKKGASEESTSVKNILISGSGFKHGSSDEKIKEPGFSNSVSTSVPLLMYLDKVSL